MSTAAPDVKGDDALGRGRPGAERRADVQGLRAVAVILVVAFHAGFPVPGGFVGVDVFFVISGLVIGRLLLGEVEGTGSIRLGRFLARRVRRLLPLLALVVAVTLGASILVTNPFPVEPVTARTGATGLLSVANIYLYRHTGYFDLRSDEANPLLHLWSLSVEEQFYLALPALLILLAVLHRRLVPKVGRRRFLGVVLGLGCVGSFGLSWLLATGHVAGVVEAPERLGFYASPPRAWEMGLGVLLAVGHRRLLRISPAVAAVFGVVGAGVLLGSALLTDPLAPFPGPGVLPATVAAALLLVAGARSRPIAAVLGSPPLRWVGDRSYGWYLWHWPAIVLVDHLWPGHRLAVVTAALASLGLAAVTHPLVEERFRADTAIVGWRAVRLAGACLVVPLILVVATESGSRHGWGLEEPLGWYETPNGRNVGCVLFNRDLPNTWPEEACTTQLPGAEGTVLVVGDTYADGVTPAVEAAGRALGLDVAEWARAGCPFGTVAPRGFDRCADWQGDVLDLVDRLDPVAVVIADRPPAGSGGTPAVGAAGAETLSVEEWAAGLDGVLGELAARDVPAVVMAPAPDFGSDFPRDRLSPLRPHPATPSLSRLEVEDQRREALAVQEAVVADHPEAVLVDPVPALCSAICTPVSEEGSWLYYDGEDLALTGSARLTGMVSGALRKARES